MNRAEYDTQYKQFDIASERCGQPRPAQRIPVLDEDAADHTGKELSWPYVLHLAWAAERLARNRPQRHVDFGSYAYFAALCRAWVPEFEFYDIRGLGFDVPGLKAGKMDLTRIQLPDNSCESVSCLHVLEHVGLGRYTDRLDPEGHIKAARELVRILKPGGTLLMVLPMSENDAKVVFNAHRILSLTMVMAMFPQMGVTAMFIADKKFCLTLPSGAAEYTGCFEFVK